MKPRIAVAWRSELRAAEHAEAQGNTQVAWRSLERAHVLSQSYSLAHVIVHARMLGFALRQRDLRELSGQIPRLLLAAPASWFGRAPLGNTGGARVGILQRMPIPDDLRAILDR